MKRVGWILLALCVSAGAQVKESCTGYPSPRIFFSSHGLIDYMETCIAGKWVKSMPSTWDIQRMAVCAPPKQPDQRGYIPGSSMADTASSDIVFPHPSIREQIEAEYGFADDVPEPLTISIGNSDWQSSGYGTAMTYDPILVIDQRELELRKEVDALKLRVLELQKILRAKL